MIDSVERLMVTGAMDRGTPGYSIHQSILPRANGARNGATPPAGGTVRWESHSCRSSREFASSLSGLKAERLYRLGRRPEGTDIADPGVESIRRLRSDRDGARYC